VRALSRVEEHLVLRPAVLAARARVAGDEARQTGGVLRVEAIERVATARRSAADQSPDERDRSRRRSLGARARGAERPTRRRRREQRHDLEPRAPRSTPSRLPAGPLDERPGARRAERAGRDPQEGGAEPTRARLVDLAVEGRQELPLLGGSLEPASSRLRSSALRRRSCDHAASTGPCATATSCVSNGCSRRMTAASAPASCRWLLVCVALPSAMAPALAPTETTMTAIAKMWPSRVCVVHSLLCLVV
jgi:hypothetical protein